MSCGFMKSQIIRCERCVESCPIKVIRIEEVRGSCIRIDPEGFRVIKGVGCSECGICIESCPINRMIGTDIFGMRGIVKNGYPKSVEGCNTCFICRGVPACMSMKYHRGLKELIAAILYCLYFRIVRG